MLSFQQRFDKSLNCHPHIHGIAIDGVYALDPRTGEPRFHFTRAPDHADIERVAAKVATHVTRMLRRRGLIGETRHDTNETAPIDEAIDGCHLAGLSRGRFEKIDEHGRAQQRLFPDDDVRFARRNNSAWAANVDGFSVEAGVRFGALDRKGRERLVRYCLRPPIAMDRFSILRDGSIAQLTKYPRGRATHRVMSAIECMARLAALVPPPRFPLWRYHGVLASASPWRSRVVPHKPVTTNARGAHASAAKPTKPPSDERLEHGSPTTARTRKPDRSKNVEPSAIAVAQTPTPAPNAPAPAQQRCWRPSTSYVPWAQLILHRFLVDVLACPSPCTGRLVPVAVIRSRQGIDRILAHLRLPLAPASLDDAEMIAFDVTGEPIPHWAVGLDPLPDARSPPDEACFIDPPAPDD